MFRLSFYPKRRGDFFHHREHFFFPGKYLYRFTFLLQIRIGKLFASWWKKLFKLRKKMSWQK
jgi:hypothetical protein